MRNRLLGRVALILLGGLAGVLTMAWTHGQAPPPPRDLPPDFKVPDAKTPPAVRPVVGTNTVKLSAVAPAPAPKPRAPVAWDRFRNFEKLPDFTRQMAMSALTGMEWLHRYNQAHGLFLSGYLPAVNQPIEEEHLFHQAFAAFVLARAARFTGDERYAVRANQAVLALLAGTSVEPGAPGVRRPAQPSVVCNRLGTAGFLVLAVCELPEPAADLVGKAEELCAFIRQQQRDDGTLSVVDSPTEVAEADGVNRYPGVALCAVAASQRLRPAAWKTELLRKAVPAYRKWFKEHPDPAFVPWMTAACVEAYLMSKDAAPAEFAFEMNDWLCALQYEQSPDPRKPLWRGGFKSVRGGKVEAASPGIEAAPYAQSLADCCRLVRSMNAPDLTRYDRYRTSLVRAAQFLTSLQFTESNTLHFASNYRMMLVGGFHPTHADGNLRIEQSAAGVSAFIQFLACGADRTQ
jgi:hypothetical protein